MRKVTVNMKISVALAAYNGEKYIAEQISSILPRLGENDEIIVSDDNPSGKTREAVLSIGDSRIKYVEGKGHGVIKNFENALSKCSGDLIFLCDQDDVWKENKVKRVKEEIEKGSDLILHDSQITDSELNIISPSYFAEHNSNISYSGNIIRNSFVGCCMAFKKELLKDILPFPEGIPMHDQWIGLAALKKGYKVSMINEPLILWRRHGENVTGGKTSFLQKIKWRISIIKPIIKV